MNNKRLNAIYEIFDCQKVIDIGSDHGYLPLELLKNQKVNEAVIVEVNQGPLDNAIKNTHRYNQMNHTKHILSNGLQQVDYEEVTGGIIIAGMGGKLIRTIIDQDLEKFKQAKLFLQPNNNEAKLRQYLVNNNFKIENNFLVKDEGIIYEIIVASPGTQTLSETEILFGVNTRGCNLFTEKWYEQKEYLEKLILKIRKNGHVNSEMESEYQKICDILGVENEIK